MSKVGFLDTKPHYDLLDGLRGVAALMVVIYHIFEGFSFAQVTNGAGDGLIRVLNHGYLAVDFFFILSGFVISYAYDKRWSEGKFTLQKFFKRRLIRLHPMVIFGAVVGVVTFFISGREQWGGEQSSFGAVILAFIFASVMIPAYPGARYDVRGNGEMFSLNGPTWSLFFEYIGNILYALFIRKFSDRLLKRFTIVLALCWIVYAVGNFSGYGSMGVGWTLDWTNFTGGMIRMLFPFSLGMFLSRTFKPLKVTSPFWWCSLILLSVFAVPYIPGGDLIIYNGIYEALCVIVIFPTIVLIAASGDTKNHFTAKFNSFLGDLSYPLYVVHYPIMYLFYKWCIENEVYFIEDCWYQAFIVLGLSLLLAFLALRLFDMPLRKYLLNNKK